MTGITETPARHGQPLHARARNGAGWLAAAMTALALLAIAAAVVSWDAQYVMVAAARHTPAIAALEAGRPRAWSGWWRASIPGRYPRRAFRRFLGKAAPLGEGQALRIVAGDRHLQLTRSSLGGPYGDCLITVPNQRRVGVARRAQ
jgi:hypothetical protein